MSIVAMNWVLRLSVKLLLKNGKQVPTVPITPVGDQLQLFGIVFDEAFEELNRSLFSLYLVLNPLFVVLIGRHSQSLQLMDCGFKAYSPMAAGSE